METRNKSIAKWGAACAPCAAAKAKCLHSNEIPGSKCDRCERLFRDCTRQVHRPRKKRASKPSRTAQLEQKLNGLVDLLRVSDLHSAGRSDDLARSSASPNTEAMSCFQDSSGSAQQRPSPPDSSQSPSGQIVGYIPETYNSFAPPMCFCRPTADPVLASSETDEARLDMFRTFMCPLFPFVLIPPDATPAQLEETKPFLLSVIRMVTSTTNMRSMKLQMYRIMQHIADYMLLRAERSLDLAQGLLVVLGWYHHHCLMHAQLSNLIHLAMSLLTDLGLNRHPRLAERTKLMVLNPPEPTPRTNEERRVYLGVWYLNSCISISFQKTESMKFSAYTEESLKELEAARETETDIYLVHLVRIQHLTEKIYSINSGNDTADSVSGIPRAPMSAYQSAFQAELDRIQNSLSKSLQNDKFLQLQIVTAALYLYEPPVIDADLLSKLSSALRVLSPAQASVLDIFYRSHTTLRAWFEHWLSIPVPLYQWVPMPMCMQLIYGVTMLGRWARLVGPLRPPGPYGPIQVIDPSGLPSQLPGLGTAASAGAPVGASMTATSALPTRDPPDVPAAIAALREQLRSQPQLALDIPAVLAAIGGQFEAADKMCGDNGPTIWDLCAKKVLITRAKLEKWAEIIAAGGVDAVLAGLVPREEKVDEVEAEDADGEEAGGEYDDTDGPSGSFSGTDNSSGSASMAPPDDILGYADVYTDDLFGVDLMEGLDPCMWFDSAGSQQPDYWAYMGTGNIPTTAMGGQ